MASKFKSCDPCVANKIIEGYPLPIVLHVDIVKEIITDTKLVRKFGIWIDFLYVYPNIWKVKSVRVKVHKYLSITLDCTTKGEVKLIYKSMWKTWLMSFR